MRCSIPAGCRWSVTRNLHLDGREFQTYEYSANGTLLRTLTANFAQRSPVSWWTGDPLLAPPNDPRVVSIATVLNDSGQSWTQTFGYDNSVPFNNRNNIKEYDYDSTLLRETRTTFVTSTTYTGAGVSLLIHLLRRKEDCKD